MVDRYLERGKMYVLEDDGVKSECVVTDEGNGILEIKNLATVLRFQRKGYGKELILFLEKEYNADFSSLQVGTGESALTVPFYEKCGFTYSHRIKDFFTEHYDHPIYENGIQLKDMIYMLSLIHICCSRACGRSAFKQDDYKRSETAAFDPAESRRRSEIRSRFVPISGSQRRRIV